MHEMYLIVQQLQDSTLCQYNYSEWLIGENNSVQRFSFTSSNSGADLSPF